MLRSKLVDAPNYFDDAWKRARRCGKGMRRRRGTRWRSGEFRFARTGSTAYSHRCISKEAKKSIEAIEPDLSPTRWRLLTTPIGGVIFWARTIVQDTPCRVNPFRLAAKELPIAGEDRRNMMIVCRGIRSAQQRDGFVLLAAIDDRFGPGFPHSARPSRSILS